MARISLAHHLGTTTSSRKHLTSSSGGFPHFSLRCPSLAVHFAKRSLCTSGQRKDPSSQTHAKPLCIYHHLLLKRQDRLWSEEDVVRAAVAQDYRVADSVFLVPLVLWIACQGWCNGFTSTLPHRYNRPPPRPHQYVICIALQPPIQDPSVMKKAAKPLWAEKELVLEAQGRGGGLKRPSLCHRILATLNL